MDHSYRAVLSGNNGHKPRAAAAGLWSTTIPSLSRSLCCGLEDGNSRIFAFVDDLFFLAKIQETARKMNVKVEFVKTDKDLLEKHEAEWRRKAFADHLRPEQRQRQAA